MKLNVVKLLYMLAIVFGLTSCVPPMYATGYNPTTSSDDSGYIIHPVTFNTGAFINQCWQSKYYSDELHDAMLSAYITEHEKRTGIKPVITDFKQYVDYSICNRLVYNFVNPGYIPSVNKYEEKWYEKSEGGTWELVK